VKKGLNENMKIKKYFAIIAVVSTAITLGGCVTGVGEDIIVETAPTIDDGILIEPAPVIDEIVITEPAPVIDEVVVTEPAPVIDEVVITEPAPVTLWFGTDFIDSVDLKSDIINVISESQIMNRNSEVYGNISEHRVAEITDFYLPNIEIAGFELINASIYKGGFEFSYEEIDSLSSYRRVQLTIIRTDAHENNPPPTASIEDIAKFFGNAEIKVRTDAHENNPPPTASIEGIAELFGNAEIKEGFVYIKGSNMNEIMGRLDKTWFHIYVPSSFSFEDSRDIAQQVINTAELVDVAHELEVNTSG
jgi:predicted small secreted protein